MRLLSESLTQSTEYGNKASGLARLLAMGFAVPAAILIAPNEELSETAVWKASAELAGRSFDSSGRMRLAVRSSAPAEDRSTGSLAGSFKSILADFEPSDLMQAVKEVRESGDAELLPVIVQVGVESEISGIAFSCDPVSLERAPFVVSWVNGTGARLASGRETGSLVVLNSAAEDRDVWPRFPGKLHELISAVSNVERELECPADVEWAIDKSKKLWMLQARPVVLPQPQCVDVRSGPELLRLRGVVAGHPKMRLRVAASRRAVKMSNAAILTIPSGAPLPGIPDGIPSTEAAGLSIVLLHPYLTSNKIQREFAQVDDMDVPFFTRGCRRYSIRRYPSRETAAAVAGDVLMRGLEQNWMASVVVQEIYDAEATGIVRRLGNEFIAELAVGHFVPKGVVDPSRLIVSASGQAVESHRVPQETAYRFINGHVVTEHPLEEQLQLSDDEIAFAIKQISPLFNEYPDAALEFGIRRLRDGNLSGYVIDMAEEDSQSCARLLTRELISMGVMSPGRVTGKVIRVQNASEFGLDTHLLEKFDASGNMFDGIVVVADRASVDLLPLVGKCGKNTAFVFRHASLLAHLCVVLRERGIAAMVVEDSELFGQLSASSAVSVNATEGDDGARVLPEGSCGSSLVSTSGS